MTKETFAVYTVEVSFCLFLFSNKVTSDNFTIILVKIDNL